MITKSSGSISLVLVLAACGGTRAEGHDPPADAGSVFDASPTAAPPPASLGPILSVTAGWVFQGDRYLDDGAHRIVPEQICELGAPKHFWAAPFRLSTFEVTNAAYQACVTEGACSPPDVTTTPAWNAAPSANLPVAVSYPLARTFCRHYGGDVPTAVEWDRAAAGDVVDAFGIPSLTDSWLQCHYGMCSDICIQLARAVPSNGPGNACDGSHPTFSLAAVGSSAWDRGPFGHADLYGNAEEWVRTSALSTDPNFCALPDYGPDPSSFTQERPYGAEVRQFGETFLEPNAPYPGVTRFDGRADFRLFIRNWDKPTPYTGFRCAFPPEGG